MKKHFTVLLLVFFCSGSYSQTIITDTLVSATMQKKVAVTVILPAKYDSTKTYPVYYFLHWWGGNNESYTDSMFMNVFGKRNFIIVTPDADTLWYVNSATIPQNKYEDFMTEELFKYIDTTYHPAPGKQAIGGYSMGGYGALLIGLKHSERFAFIADISGAINPPFPEVPLTAGAPINFIINSVRVAFGNQSPKKGVETDIFGFLKKTSKHPKLYIFMAAGDEDEFDFIVPQHRILKNLLDEMAIKNELNIYP